jgi:succinate-semialdehyde dehydrogenase / glutarate-semialdehyde dehydrogenase
MNARSLRAIAAAIEDQQEELAQILVAEAGKPIKQSRDEAAGAARFFSYVASLLETLVDEIRYAEQSREQTWTVRRPHGVVAAIIPRGTSRSPGRSPGRAAACHEPADPAINSPGHRQGHGLSPGLKARENQVLTCGRPPHPETARRPAP